ncbi:hypothetical protein F0U60_41470 [Archangium minus]|uniref:Uncharacterized protein n=1 Tax=Archangium minus TaxID=83450 RepID=A0ABY9X3H3_9BACT|nr:hypothetical protein F0U61_41585 [Archangium violaceum]WNG49874.1 hypothetical protein F0U60_41470 [Archangium minus]
MSLRPSQSVSLVALFGSLGSGGRGPEPPSGTSEPPSGTSEPPSGTSEPPSGTSEPPSGTSEPPSGTSEPPSPGLFRTHRNSWQTYPSAQSTVWMHSARHTPCRHRCGSVQSEL